ncbi:F0F1 ATP synthase subunit A [Patescibacteria group bacterium]|nr:F0F1 ATP synthase subunit A [Patescibacteria group bacterium]
MDLTITPKILTYIAGFPITNTFWVTILLSILLILVFVIGSHKMREVPKGLQLWLEVIVGGTRSFMDDATNSNKVTNRLHPWILTIFLLFIVGNVISFIPGLPALTYNGELIYRTATTDYNMVFIIALVFLIVAQAVSITTGGFFGYIKKFINFRSPLKFILAFFEIIGEIAKLISVSFRFFGNAFAAEVLLAVLFIIFPYILPLPFMMILLLSSVVQPAVFALLIMVYIQMSIVDKEPIVEKNHRADRMPDKK